MKNTILIIGQSESGKTRLARDIASQYEEDEVVFIQGSSNWLKPGFYFNDCTEKTKLVIIDDYNAKHFNPVIFLHGPAVCNDTIEVNKKGMSSFNIKVRLILISDGSITKKVLTERDTSFLRRFNIIECHASQPSGFNTRMTPKQFIKACSQDELQQLDSLLKLKKLDDSHKDVSHWINLYQESNYSVEELEAISLRVHKDQTINRSEKIAILMAITKILTDTTGDPAVIAARNVLDIAYQYNKN